MRTDLPIRQTGRRPQAIWRRIVFSETRSRDAASAMVRNSGAPTDVMGLEGGRAFTPSGVVHAGMVGGLRFGFCFIGRASDVRMGLAIPNAAVFSDRLWVVVFGLEPWT